MNTEYKMPEGGLLIVQREYICPVHGNVGHNTMTSHMKGLEKVLCMRCYVEKLIEIGVCEVTERKS